MKTLRVITIILLFFNVITAISGGLCLMIDPSGKMIQLPIELLKNSPFCNYFIPGIILFLFVGLLSLYVAFSTIRKIKYYQYMVIMEGMALLVWICVEMIITHTFEPLLHLTYVIISSILLIFGLLLNKKRLAN